MEKKSVKVLGLFLFGLFMINLFAGFVVAETLVEKIVTGIGETGISVPGNDFFEGTGFAKFLLFLLVALIVFGVSELMPFLGGKNKNWISGGIAIVVGILATFYLKDTEIYSILLSYGALGITLTVLIPFMLILFMSVKLREDGYGFFSKVLWLVFGIVLLFRWLFADSSEIGSFGSWMYPITALAVLIMFMWGDKIGKAIQKSKIESGIDKMANERKMRRAGIKEDIEDVSGYMGSRK